MPYVTVKMLEGRTEDQKKALVEKVTAAVSETTGAPTDAVTCFHRRNDKKSLSSRWSSQKRFIKAKPTRSVRRPTKIATVSCLRRHDPHRVAQENRSNQKAFFAFWLLLSFS